MKKKLSILVLIFIYVIYLMPLATSFLSYNSNQMVIAEDTETSGEDLEEDLKDTVSDQIDHLDFSSLEKLLQKLTGKEFELFGSSSFIEKLQSIMSGTFADGSNNIFEAILNLIFDDILSFIPLIATVIAIAVLASMVDGIRPNKNKNGIGGIIHFVSYGIIVLLLFSSVMQMLELTSATLSSIKLQMDAAFPILLTLLTALGGTVSVSVYQPAVAFLSGAIIQIFNYVLMPIFIFSLVFSVLSNISDNVKLDKFSSFFSSLFKWSIGFIFTIFMSFATIQGITAGSFDGVSIRTAKFAIRSYIPILGGYLSEGFNLILASSVLIKNAVGATGLILLFATIIVPIVKLVIFMFALKLMAAIIEPISNSKIANFISSLAKSIVMLIVMLIGVSFMYLIITGLIMCSANIV